MQNTGDTGLKAGDKITIQCACCGNQERPMDLTVMGGFRMIPCSTKEELYNWVEMVVQAGRLNEVYIFPQAYDPDDNDPFRGNTPWWVEERLTRRQR